MISKKKKQNKILLLALMAFVMLFCYFLVGTQPSYALGYNSDGYIHQGGTTNNISKDGYRYYKGHYTGKTSGAFRANYTFRYYDQSSESVKMATNTIEKGAEALRKHYVTVGSDDWNAYCIESGIMSAKSTELAKAYKPESLGSWTSLTAGRREAINLVMMFGRQPGYTDPKTCLGVSGANEFDYYVGTQILIWEFQQGIRDNISDTTREDNGNIKSDTYSRWYATRPAVDCASQILKKARAYKSAYKLSFAEYTEDGGTIPTWCLLYRPDSDDFSVTLTDNNECGLSGSYVQGKLNSVASVSYNSSAHTYALTRTSSLSGPYTSEEMHKLGSREGLNKMIAYKQGIRQQVILGADQVRPFKMKINTENRCVIKLIKKIENDIPDKVNTDNDSFKFKITCSKPNPNGSGTLTRTWYRTLTPGSDNIATLTEYFPTGDFTISEVCTAEQDDEQDDEYSTTHTANGSNVNGMTSTFSLGTANDINNPYEITFTNTLNKDYFRNYSINIQKKDKDTDEAVEKAGFQFKVYNKTTGKYVVNERTNSTVFTTDIAGGISGIKIEDPGDYVITEVGVPSDGHYKLDAESQTFTVLPTDVGDAIVKSFTLSDTPIKGKIQVHKTLEGKFNTSSSVESGAKFQVYDSSYASYAACPDAKKCEITTDTNGNATTKDLTMYKGDTLVKYVIKQISAPTGSELASDVFTTIDSETVVKTVNIVNERKTATVIVEKRDTESNNLVSCASTQFCVKDVESGKYITKSSTLTTSQNSNSIYSIDENGTLTLPIKLPYGSYQIIETTAPDGYLIDSSPLSFIINDTNADTITVTKYNVQQKGEITVNKVGKAFTGVENIDGKYVPKFEDRPIENVSFQLIAKEEIRTNDNTRHYNAGDVVATGSTNSNGQLKFQNLYLGSYVVKEISVPNGYIQNDTQYDAVPTYNPNVTVAETQVNVSNTRQKAKVILEKSLEKDDLFGFDGSGLDKVSFGLYAKENLVASDNSTIPANGLIAVAKAIDKGEYYEFSFSGASESEPNLPFGNYYVKEISTNDGYALDNTMHNVSFVYDASQGEYITYNLTNGNPVENKIIRGTISCSKTTDENEPLRGALFGLFKSDETDFIEETALMTATSDNEGKVNFENVAYGQYIVKELKAPEGFVLDKNTYNAKITTNGEILSTIKSVNKYQKFTIALTKKGDVPSKFSLENGIYSTEFSDGVLANAVYEVIAKEDVVVNGITKYTKGQVADTITTNNQGDATSKPLYIGTYVVKEKTPPLGYTISDEELVVSGAYQGQDVETFTRQTQGFDNIQSVEITLNKELESLSEFGYSQNTSGDVSFGLYSKNQITALDKSVLPKDGLVAVGHLGSDNHVVFTGNIPVGEYYVKEISTVEGYVLDTKEYDITFGDATQTGEIASISVNNGDTLLNVIKKGQIQLMKIDSNTGMKLTTTAVFNLYRDTNENGTYEVSTDTLVGTLDNTKKGIYQYKGVPYGKYLVKEIKAPTGYQLDTESYPVEILEDGSLIEVKNSQEGFVNEAKLQPTTGDNGEYGMLIAIFMGLMMMIGSLILIRNKNNR